MCATSTPAMSEKALNHRWSYANPSDGKLYSADVAAWPTVINWEVALRTSFTSLCSHALKLGKFPWDCQYEPAMSASLKTSHIAIADSVAYFVMRPRSYSTRCA